MTALLDDITECGGRVPDPNALRCPMRHRCERHLAFIEKADRGEPHRRPCLMPPATAYARAGQPSPTWECRHFMPVEEVEA